MASDKQKAQRVLDSLPEDASLEDIRHHLKILQHVEYGRRDVAAGRVLSQAEAERRMARWLDK